MKKVVVLVICLMCVLSACKHTNSSGEISSQSNTIESPNKISNSIDNNSAIQYINPSQFTFSTGDCEITNSVSRDVFTEPIECMCNGSKITIDTPKFTGIPVESVYSYKKNYQFIDGYVIFDVSTDNGLMYFKVDKNGKTISANDNYAKITEGRDSDKYMEEFLTAKEIQEGRIVGNDVMIKQFGEPGSYVQYLYSVDGERLSGGYDSISYFFNGLALAEKDKKVGLIDENGNEILTPSISFDTIIYPPKNKGYFLNFMFEDAFVIPIDGEFAVINIQR